MQWVRNIQTHIQMTNNGIAWKIERNSARAHEFTDIHSIELQYMCDGQSTKMLLKNKSIWKKKLYAIFDARMEIEDSEKNIY